MSESRKPYYIVNRKLTCDGKSLAVTYNGSDAILTVTEFQKLPTQAWLMKGPGGGAQDISSVRDPGLFVSYTDEGNLRPIDGAAIIWTVMGDVDLYTIRYFDLDLIWNLKEAKVDEPILTRFDPEGNNPLWKLIPVDED